MTLLNSELMPPLELTLQTKLVCDDTLLLNVHLLGGKVK